MERRGEERERTEASATNYAEEAAVRRGNLRACKEKMCVRRVRLHAHEISERHAVVGLRRLYVCEMR